MHDLARKTPGRPQTASDPGPNRTRHPTLDTHNAHPPIIRRDRSGQRRQAEGRPTTQPIAPQLRPSYDIRHLPVRPTPGGTLTPRARGNSPDAREREADKMADTVLRMPDASWRSPCACGATCSRCREGSGRARAAQSEGGIRSASGAGKGAPTGQTPLRPSDAAPAGAQPALARVPASHMSRAANGNRTMAHHARDHSDLGPRQHSVATPPAPHAGLPSIIRQVLNGPGAPLDPAARSFMEPRFGADLGGVRIHTGALAARSARAVGAQAYAVGQHIAFDEGLYQTDTAAGLHLLAHELAHVIQQQPGRVEGNGATTGARAPALQRAPQPAVAAAVAVLALAVACGLPFHQYAMANYGHKTDKWRHCWVSCQMSRTCGTALTQVAGLGKELRDRAVAAYCSIHTTAGICQGGQGDFWDSIQDLVANQECIVWESHLIGPLPRLWRQGCADCCDASGL